jgi:hypothetical protein
MAEKFSCSPTAEEEGTYKFLEVSRNQDETYTEETASENFQSISNITKNKNNPFAAWQPFIPSNRQEHAYPSSPAQPWWQVSSAPPCSSQEPTLTAISSINCFPLKEAIKPTPLPTHKDKTRNQPRIDPSPQRTWKPYKGTGSHCNYSWNKHWPRLNKTSRTTKTSPNDFPDHLEQSKLSKPWKLQLPSLDEPSQTQNTKSPNTPLETDAGGMPQLNIRWPSRICSSTTSKLNMIKTRFWGTKLQKWSDKTFTWHNKHPAPTRHPPRNSKRTPSWAWSPRPWPPTCFSNITMTRNATATWKCRISHHGGSHFSKRRSESEGKRNQKSESQKRYMKIRKV